MEYKYSIDNVIIHYYKRAKHFKTITSFRHGKKIVSEMAMVDLDGVMDYMKRKDFCNGLPYRIINHK